MLRYMLDTNICIFVIKNKPSSLRKIFNQNSHRLCISSVTLAELLYGVEKSARVVENRRTVQSFTARLKVLDFGNSAAEHYGEVRATLERNGTPIGPYDLMIAGHARSEGLIMVTDNVKEFSRVDGLIVENWKAKAEDLSMDIPQHEPEAVNSMAKRNYRGDDEKVPTTSISSVNFKGVNISSRYGKAHELQVMKDVISKIDPKTLSLIKQVWCDSKATAVYSVDMSDCEQYRVDHVAFLLDKLFCEIDSGHNGIFVSSANGCHAYEDPNWPGDRF